MDLLKAMLLYMVLLTGSATQATGATPLPYEALHTPTPTPVVTQAPTPTPEPTATPTPSPSPTPRIYLLTIGSAGTSVRTLQARLQELGYLQEKPDGHYGPKTAEAVTWFQQVNGLEADGVAGRLTQEKLYYDPDVLPAPQDTPVPETLN